MEKKIEYPKLPKVFKRKWVKALRSGKYDQGRGKLYRAGENDYCCLGVACVVDKIPLKRIQGKSVIAQLENESNNLKILNGEDRKSDDLVDILVSMNDNVTASTYNQFMGGKYWEKQRSFKQIANWIEHNL